jgi:hypothetical protein
MVDRAKVIREENDIANMDWEGGDSCDTEEHLPEAGANARVSQRVGLMTTLEYAVYVAHTESRFCAPMV